MIQYNHELLAQIICLLQKLHPRFILPAKPMNDIEATVLWTRLKEIINPNEHIWAWACHFPQTETRFIVRVWNFGPYYTLKNPIYDHAVSFELLCLF